MIPVRLRRSVLYQTAGIVYRTNPGAFLVAVGSTVISGLTYPVFLLALKWLLSSLLTVQRIGLLGSGAVFAVAALLTVVLVQRLLATWRESAILILREESLAKINQMVMRKLADVPYHLFEDNDFQSRYGLAIREASHRTYSLLDSLLASLLSAVSLLGVLMALSAVAPILVIVLVFVTVPSISVESWFAKAAVDLQSASAPLSLRMQFLSHMQVDAGWQRDLRVSKSTVLLDEYAALAATYIDRLKRVGWRFQGLRLGAALITVLGIAAALGVSLLLVSSGHLGVTEIGVFVPGIYLLVISGQSLSYNFRTVAETLAYAAKILEFVGMDFGRHTTAIMAVAPGYEPPYRVIRLSNVTYVYPNGRAALSGVSCDLGVGITAIVGPNGAGKSTLVKLLAGLVEPTSGKINAVSSAGEEVPLNQVSKGVLFQSPCHFHLTVRQNVTMRHRLSTAEDERVWGALRTAGLMEVVQRLPEGLDTVVGSGFGGFTDLSGGQWQRLAVARLIYNDSPLVMLDEPVASLDAAGERAIFELFASLQSTKIILFTTHRRDTIDRTANVVLLTDGIVERIEKSQPDITGQGRPRSCSCAAKSNGLIRISLLKGRVIFPDGNA